MKKSKVTACCLVAMLMAAESLMPAMADVTNPQAISDNMDEIINDRVVVNGESVAVDVSSYYYPASVQVTDDVSVVNSGRQNATGVSANSHGNGEKSSAKADVGGSVSASSGTGRADGVSAVADVGTTEVTVGGNVSSSNSSTDYEAHGIVANAAGGGKTTVTVSGNVSATGGDAGASGISNEIKPEPTEALMMGTRNANTNTNEENTEQSLDSKVTVNVSGTVNAESSGKTSGIEIKYGSGATEYVSSVDEGGTAPVIPKTVYDISVNGITAKGTGSEIYNNDEEIITSGINVTSGLGSEVKITVGDGGIKADAETISAGIIASNILGDISILSKGDVIASGNAGLGIIVSDRNSADYSSTDAGLAALDMDIPRATDTPGSTKIAVEGDVNGSAAGLMVSKSEELDGLYIADVLVEGTIHGEKAAGVLVSDGVNEDTLKLTVWKVDLAQAENAETKEKTDAVVVNNLGNTTETTKAIEKSIQYIIKVEQPQAGATLTATGEGGAALAKSHDFDVAKEGENVYLKVDVQDGYKLTGAFNGLGEKVALVLDGKTGNYYVSVPKGGGVYLSAVLEKLPDPEPEPNRTPDPTPDPTPDRRSTGFGGGSDGEGRYLGIGRWAKNDIGWYFTFFLGGSAKNTVLYIDKKSSGQYLPGYYGFGEDGYMVKGWTFINGYWYYFDPVIGLMKTGWVTIDGAEYYLNENTGKDIPYGALYINTTTPDGSKVNADGKKI